MGLFCKHIWKEEEEIYLRSFRRDDSYYLSVYPEWNTYRVYARIFRCLKCGKKKIEEIEKLVL